jgi:YD repeat-containing protein
VTYTYDDAGHLIKSYNEDTDLTTEYEWDEDGNLIARSEEMDSKAIGLFEEGDTAEFTYSYDAENRLKAVREGGSLLMAASYDGDGNRIFQVHRTLVPFGIEKSELSESSFDEETPGKGDAIDVDDPLSAGEAFQRDERDSLTYPESA